MSARGTQVRAIGKSCRDSPPKTAQRNVFPHQRREDRRPVPENPSGDFQTVPGIAELREALQVQCETFLL